MPGLSVPPQKEPDIVPESPHESLQSQQRSTHASSPPQKLTKSQKHRLREKKKKQSTETNEQNLTEPTTKKLPHAYLFSKHTTDTPSASLAMITAKVELLIKVPNPVTIVGPAADIVHTMTSLPFWERQIIAL